MSSAPPLDRVTRTAALGVRFWDSVAGRAVAEGLELLETSTGKLAIPNRSNVFAFHDLPGLRAASFGSGDAAFWSSPPASGRFTFEVTDRDRRFIPFRFSAEVLVRPRLRRRRHAAGGGGFGDLRSGSDCVARNRRLAWTSGRAAPLSRAPLAGRFAASWKRVPIRATGYPFESG
jgi:hypothetical protein